MFLIRWKMYLYNGLPVYAMRERVNRYINITLYMLTFFPIYGTLKTGKNLFFEGGKRGGKGEKSDGSIYLK